jgi:hypothetical protein
VYKAKKGVGKARVEKNRKSEVRTPFESPPSLFHLLEEPPPLLPEPPTFQQEVFPCLLRPTPLAEPFRRVERKKGFRCAQVGEVESKSKEKGRVVLKEGVDVA